MPKISIVIPCYEFNGYGKNCLFHSFKILKEQTFKDFNIIISDHSKDTVIENFCKEEKELNIKYIRNEEKRGNPAFNLNVGIANADGEWIKILCQDDFLYDKNSLEIINNNLSTEKKWIASAYLHTRDRKNFFNPHFPFLHQQLYIINTIGTPSCTCFKNIKPFLEFDEELYYCYDCDFYFRFMEVYGKPLFIQDFTIVNYLWDNSISSRITNEFITKENTHILKKLGVI